MNTSSPQPYYLPNIQDDAGKEEYSSHDETMTDDSTLTGHDCLHDDDRNTLLSGTTRGEERDIIPATAGINVFESSNGLNPYAFDQTDAVAPFYTESVQAFNDSTNNPLLRASDRTPPNHAHADRPKSPPVDPKLNSVVSGHDIWDCTDFVDRVRGEGIQLKGLFNDFFDLDDLTRQWGYVRQETSGAGQLCGLHALVISLNARLAQVLIDKGLPNFTSSTLLNILNGPNYHDRVQSIRDSAHDAATGSELGNELSSPRNLSVDQIYAILCIVGTELNHPLQLGVCASSPPDVNERPSSLYNVYRINNREEGQGDATTIWLVNEDYGGNALNHWSGIAPDPTPSTPDVGQVANQTPHRRVASGKAMPARKVANKRVKHLPKHTTSNQATGARGSTPLSPSASEIYCPLHDCRRRYHVDAAKRKPFINRKARDHHLKTVHIPYEQRKHVCDSCPDKPRFTYPKDLERHHINKHAGGHPQWCIINDCHYFGKGQPKSNLRRHYEIHSPHEWEACQKRFKLE